MKEMKKKLLIMVLFFAVCGGIGFSMPKYVSAKSVSKVTKTFTLTTKSNFVEHKLSISKKEKVTAKIKFLEVKGNVSLKSGEDLSFGGYEFPDGMGSFFADWTKPKLKKSSFKKGNVLNAKKNEDYISKKSTVEWYLPSGLKKLKVQVTYFTKSGKAGINSVK